MTVCGVTALNIKSAQKYTTVDNSIFISRLKPFDIYVTSNIKKPEVIIRTYINSNDLTFNAEEIK